MIKKTFTTACAFVFVLCLPRQSFGCECRALTVAEAFAEAEAVFVGRAVETGVVKEASVYQTVRAGTDWPWEKSVKEVGRATLEVVEAFKAAPGDAVEVTSGLSPKGCGVEFKAGQIYLVYARKRRPFLNEDAAELPKDNWTEEMRLKAAAEELNAKLPPLTTGKCLRTAELSERAEDVNEIRRLVKK